MKSRLFNRLLAYAVLFLLWGICPSFAQAPPDVYVTGFSVSVNPTTYVATPTFSIVYTASRDASGAPIDYNALRSLYGSVTWEDYGGNALQDNNNQWESLVMLWSDNSLHTTDYTYSSTGAGLTINLQSELSGHLLRPSGAVRAVLCFSDLWSYILDAFQAWDEDSLHPIDTYPITGAQRFYTIPLIQ